MSLLLTLVHSPLVGPATWDSVAAALVQRDHQVAVPDLTPTVSGRGPYATRQVAVVVDSVAGRPTILVGHSGAGPLLASIADALGDVHGYVFVDAGLPTPGSSWFQTAPAELSERLRDMAQDGWLPPWPEWFPPEDLAEELPDSTSRERFVAECSRLPLRMFDEALPPAPGWQHRPGAYLRLSGAYRQSAEQARSLDWPVVELASHHLAVLTDPELVVGPLLDLIAELEH